MRQIYVHTVNICMYTYVRRYVHKWCSIIRMYVLCGKQGVKRTMYIRTYMYVSCDNWHGLDGAELG